jgi:hypothetical protein
VKSPLLSRVLLLCSHAIELRAVERERDSIVPPQVGVLGEDRANPFLQISRNRDSGALLVGLLLHPLNPLPRPVAALKRAIGLRQQIVTRNHLFQTVIFELALDHFDEVVASQGVGLDALVEQDVDLGVGRVILGELLAPDRAGCRTLLAARP